MKIEDILAEYITKDYYTANIKTEVILDMILTPVIDKILTVIGQKNNLGINGEMRLLAKEFPMLKPNSCAKTDEEKLQGAKGSTALKPNRENEYNYRNCNADYLMCDNESVYFVELKTTQKSLDRNQMINYRNYLAECENEKFSNVSGAAFIELLNHVSKTGHSRSSKNKPWGDTEKDDLKRLFEAIIRCPEYKSYGKDGEKISLEKDWLEKNHHVEDAITYLKKTKAVSSKKYLLTAGQMLDNMKDGEWWDCKQIKLLYLMPKKPSDEEIKEILEYKQKGTLIVVTFQEMMELAHVLCKEMEKQGLKKYWKWVMEILTQCGLY